MSGNKLLSSIEEEKNTTIPTNTTFKIGDLHKSLQDHLLSLIGKKQVSGFGNVYFIPSLRDLEEFLMRFKHKYPELWDLRKIEIVLKNHITVCASKKAYAPAIKYFIIKEGSGSQLAAVLENFEDSTVEKQHKITYTKNMFE